MMESSDSVADESGPREWCPSLGTRDSRLTYRGAVLPGLGFWASIAIL